MGIIKRRWVKYEQVIFRYILESLFTGACVAKQIKFPISQFV